jgi:hypothetical protein
MSIWQFQRTVMGRLLSWSVISVILGALMLRFNKFWQGMGMQFIGWGVIDALIAMFGGEQSRTRMRTHPSALEPEFMDRETARLGRLLWVNTVLDVFYALGGAYFALQPGRDKERQRGTGWGVIAQSAFLFAFDLLHALNLPPTKKAWQFWDFSHGEAINQKPIKHDIE